VKVMPPFFSDNVPEIIVKFTWLIHASFTIMRLLFHKVSIIFNPLLTTLSKTLYTYVVKFSAWTFEHITNGTMKL
jgi:hypothetical protein